MLCGNGHKLMQYWVGGGYVTILCAECLLGLNRLLVHHIFPNTQSHCSVCSKNVINARWMVPLWK